MSPVTRQHADSTEGTKFGVWMERTDERFAAAEERRVEVFVRSMLPPLGAKGSQETLIERLDDLAECSAIDDVSMTVTGNRLCLCETCTGTDVGGELLDRVRELDEWGEEFDASPSPFVERRTLDSAVANQTARALVPPRVATALYCDDALAGVFPCRMGESNYAVADFLEALDRFAADRELVAEP
jgi:hypothetical protein